MRIRNVQSFVHLKSHGNDPTMAIPQVHSSKRNDRGCSTAVAATCDLSPLSTSGVLSGFVGRIDHLRLLAQTRPTSQTNVKVEGSVFISCLTLLGVEGEAGKKERLESVAD